MTITVQMTPEEYDAYRAYQKEKNALEDKAYAVANRLRSEHKNLCNQILDALRISGSGEHLTVEIADQDAAMHIVDTARDWFC